MSWRAGEGHITVPGLFLWLLSWYHFHAGDTTGKSYYYIFSYITHNIPITFSLFLSQNWYSYSLLAVGKSVLQCLSQLYKPQCQFSIDNNTDGCGVRLRYDCSHGNCTYLQVRCSEESKESHFGCKYFIFIIKKNGMTLVTMSTSCHLFSADDVSEVVGVYFMTLKE